MGWHQRRQFSALRTSALKTVRVWAMKEFAATLWNYTTPGWVLRGWERLLGWMARSQLKPMKDAWRTLKKHLWSILNAVLLKADNSRIKVLKSRARGFRNKERFRNAVYFYLGKLQLYPSGIMR